MKLMEKRFAREGRKGGTRDQADPLPDPTSASAPPHPRTITATATTATSTTTTTAARGGQSPRAARGRGLRGPRAARRPPWWLRQPPRQPRAAGAPTRRTSAYSRRRCWWREPRPPSYRRRPWRRRPAAEGGLPPRPRWLPLSRPREKATAWRQPQLRAREARSCSAPSPPSTLPPRPLP